MTAITPQHADLIRKLVYLAGGRLELVSDAIRSVAKERPRRWWHSKNRRPDYTADLVDVVRFIQQATQER